LSGRPRRCCQLPALPFCLLPTSQSQSCFRQSGRPKIAVPRSGISSPLPNGCAVRRRDDRDWLRQMGKAFLLRTGGRSAVIPSRPSRFAVALRASLDRMPPPRQGAREADKARGERWRSPSNGKRGDDRVSKTILFAADTSLSPHGVRFRFHSSFLRCFMPV